MGRLWVHLHRIAGTVHSAMSSEPNAGKLIGLFVDDDILESQPDGLQQCRTGMNRYDIVVMDRTVVSSADFDYRVHIAALLDLSIGICGVPHQRSPAEFKVAHVVRMVNNLGPICIGIENPVVTPVPHQSVGLVPHIPFVSIEYLGNKRFRLHFTPL